MQTITSTLGMAQPSKGWFLFFPVSPIIWSFTCHTTMVYE